MSKLWQLISLTVNRTYSEIVPYVPSSLNFGSWTRPWSEMSKESCHLIQAEFGNPRWWPTYIFSALLALTEAPLNYKQTKWKKPCLQLHGKETHLIFPFYFRTWYQRIQQRAEGNSKEISAQQKCTLVCQLQILHPLLVTHCTLHKVYQELRIS